MNERTQGQYTAIFEDDARGAAIFEELNRRFVRPGVYQGGIDGIRETDRRNGQREVVEYIRLRINQERGGTDVGTTVDAAGSGE